MSGVRDRWDFYQDSTGNWWWRRFRRNTKIRDPFTLGYEILVDTSSRGYEKKDNCIENAVRMGYRC
jgi:hypothetical protein